ncbi:MAG: hypothetical protein DRP09_18365 [Candidatus Thorarchaeota archaeon]|nr:MAG: hypothetical protein DRP09_18365 [Candidatus Thorarchaeota archaeon]
MRIKCKDLDIEEEISENYRVNSEKLNIQIKGIDDSAAKRNVELLKRLWNLYLTDETAWAVVQAISTIALGEDFEIEGVPKNSEEYERLKKAFDRAWMNFYGIVRDALVLGNSFSKIIRNRAGEFYNIQPLFPLEVTKKLKPNGELVYVYENKNFTQDDIFELEFFPRPDSLYSIPLLGPSKRAIERKRLIEENSAIAIARHMPRFHVVCQKDPMTGRYPSKEERRKIGQEFKDLSGDHEFVTTDLVSINVIDSKSTVPQLEDYMMWAMNSILVGSGTPPEVIGAITKSGSFATAKSRANVWLTFTIKYYQKALQKAINTQILKDTKAKIKILPPASLVLPYSK